MIIDAHAHLGTSRIGGGSTSLDELCRAMEADAVDMAILQPFPYPTVPAEEVHDQIAELARRYPGRFYGLASISPHLPEKAYYREAERCIRELGFVGLKLHPLGHLAPILSAVADKAFVAAAALGVPLMIHTGAGVPFTLPALAIPRARKFPDLSIILAHAGESLFAEEALVAALECSNVLLETSGCPPGWIRRFIGALGGERMLFGSDLTDNLRSELGKYESLEIPDADRRAALAGTAARVFDLAAKRGRQA